ncbi:tryptophan halogenase family protein [Duganella violaceipulchra]|uniref:2-polyprenyl-6-methoxyphenol hydroxylase-like FAD-dependent oxidoreductase n=1 Tax=Duganella violaceipulchra TaxID=2849652 RepID=A0AA41L7T1_9BURK|nr:tryptophan halogenase family protein [Duganella violaceicalia]MBV6321535.1 tryptophan 7-halogenase [Duganella violaceicalia]MCP2008206.1 2-polyprenyl-6-methoxyphenol hydroxylase-like FAD-dependent oxidoreductase [Duganella violaceicalia]
MVRRIVIVGGGSAGWLTAGLIAADHQGSSLQVTLIESPDIAPIGVGEGTWPSMRDTLRRIGVSEADFLRECDASFKQGSRFNRWVNGADNDYYFHPFVLPQGYGEVNLPEQWQAQHPDIPFADLVSYQPHLCVNGRAPKQVVTPEFSSVANYGYHLDAGKFGAFLRKHCLEKLGVHYVPDNVVGVSSHDNGDIAALQTQEHGALEGELFIDCTGMQSLLLGQHYEVPFISQQHVLYNDSALAVQIPYPDDNYPIASQTSSTAQSAGWIWDIGLPTRRGVGHVYSSAHIGDDQAEAELRRYIADTGGPQDIPQPRKLTFNPGYRARFWHRNCVAIGLSAGFIEPLEASALALVEMSAAMVSDELPATRAAMDIVAQRFNEAFTYRWERVIDFLKLHYVLSQRRDSDYWRDNTAAIPDRLNDLLTLWRHRAPSRNDFNRIEEVFPSASYQYVLYGMGFRSEFSYPQPRQAALADGYFREAAALTRKMLGALPDNRELINHIKRHGLQKI